MFNRLRYTAKAGALMTVLATGVLVAGASPAMADTSASTANAATLSLGGATLLSTGTCTASNAGPPNPATGPCPAPTVLAQSGIQVGVLTQQATAFPDGTSGSCAGLVGAGGTIQIGTGGVCTFTTGPSGGVVIDAGGLATIRADAILAECTASSTGASTTKVELVNATIQLLTLGVPVGQAIPLQSLPAANTPVLNLGALLSLTLNVQPPATTPPPPAGSVGATALDLSVLGVLGAPPLVHLTVGNVTCGPNAVSPVMPIFPVKGLPIALATLIGVGAVAVIVRRHRGAATNV